MVVQRWFLSREGNTVATWGCDGDHESHLCGNGRRDPQPIRVVGAVGAIDTVRLTQNLKSISSYYRSAVTRFILVRLYLGKNDRDPGQKNCAFLASKCPFLYKNRGKKALILPLRVPRRQLPQHHSSRPAPPAGTTARLDTTVCPRARSSTANRCRSAA